MGIVWGFILAGFWAIVVLVLVIALIRAIGGKRDNETSEDAFDVDDAP